MPVHAGNIERDNGKNGGSPLTGSYARDLRVYVYDGKMHPVDSNEISFRLAEGMHSAWHLKMPL